MDNNPILKMVVGKNMGRNVRESRGGTRASSGTVTTWGRKSLEGRNGREARQDR